MAIPPLEESRIETTISKESVFKDHKEILESMHRSSYAEAEIRSFIEIVNDWYPVYEEFGRDKVYLESSIFWRILTYIPVIKKFSGFETYEKLGKDAARIDIDRLKGFLKEDIPKKIIDLGKKILEAQRKIEDKRNSPRKRRVFI